VQVGAGRGAHEQVMVGAGPDGPGDALRTLRGFADAPGGL
jgi:hypothetical protein